MKVRTDLKSGELAVLQQVGEWFGKTGETLQNTGNVVLKGTEVALEKAGKVVLSKKFWTWPF